MIKDALSVLPAKPAVLAAPVIIVVVLSLYYLDLRDRCHGIRDFRQALVEHLHSLAPGSRFRMAEFTDFEWNRVRVVATVRPGTVADECLFDWNWASGERESLIEAGKLSALIFGQKGNVVGYLELRRDEIAFDEVDEQLTPESAVFDVVVDGAGAAHLTPVD